MQKIIGKLGFERAKHLLRRASWKGSFSDIESFAELTHEEASNILLEDVDFTISNETEKGRESQVITWWVDKHTGSGPTALGRLAYFLFVMFPAKLAEAHTLGAVGWLGFLDWGAFASFKEVIKALTFQNNMIRRLPNEEPNENYGREFLELFTLGTGGQIDKTSFVNFTQEDVRAVAAILSGYHYNHALKYSPQGFPIGVGAWGFVEGSKQLSDRFNSVVIDGSQAEQLEALVEAIFNHPAMGQWVIEKLIRYYVNDQDAIDLAVRDHLVTVFKSNNWELRPVLRELFSLEYFYQNMGGRVMSPWDSFMHVISYYEAAFQSSDFFDHETRLHEMGQPPLHPQEIKGEPGDYQSPLFGQYWILSPDALEYRYLNFSDKVARRGAEILAPLVEGLDFDSAAEKLARFVFAGAPIADEILKLKGEILGSASPDHWNTDKISILRRLITVFYRSAQAQLH